MVIMLKKHKSKIGEYFSYEENISLKWFAVFLVIFIIYHIFDNMLDMLFIGKEYSDILRIYIFFIRITYLLFLGIFGSRQAAIFRNGKSGIGINFQQTEFKTESILSDKADIQPIDIEKGINKNMYKSYQLLTEEKKEKFIERIDMLMVEKRLFRNPELNIYDVAHELNTNITYISATINYKKKLNFHKYINTFRVSEAANMLKSDEDLSIDDIIDHCGFNSRASFYRTFKKIKGITPSAYKKNHNNQ
jgi:AraC-like DNA-binding protein